MTLIQLQNKIRQMQLEICSQISELNSGGCIHFANLFSQKLKEKRIPFKIYFCNDQEEGPVGKTLYEFNSVCHVLVLLPEIGFIDGYKTITNPKTSFKYCTYRKFNLTKVSENYWWNPTYNTDQNHLLKKIIDKHFE